MLFAAVQYNDPDPTLWIPIYLIPAYASWQAFKGKFNTEFLIAIIIMSFCGGVQTWLMMGAWEGFFTPSLGFEMKTINQELAREACGLWIVTGTALLYVFVGLSKTKN